MHKINHHFFKNVNKLISTLKAASTLVSIYVAGLLVVVGGVQEVMRQIEFGVKLYLLLHVAVAISN